MASSRSRRLRRRATSPITRISRPRNPVAVTRSLVTPRIGYRRTRRNAWPQREPQKKPSVIRWVKPAVRSTRLHKRLGHPMSRTQLDSLNARRRLTRSGLRRQPDCVERPDPKKAGEKRQQLKGRGNMVRSKYGFRRWC